MDTKWTPILDTKWTLNWKRGRCGEILWGTLTGFNQ